MKNPKEKIKEPPPAEHTPQPPQIMNPASEKEINEKKAPVRVKKTKKSKAN